MGGSRALCYAIKMFYVFCQDIKNIFREYVRQIRFSRRWILFLVGEIDDKT